MTVVQQAVITPSLGANVTPGKQYPSPLPEDLRPWYAGHALVPRSPPRISGGL
ncbi:hypothetical protein [Streptomyces aureus]|uniref:hypothetical protein n=1 Tax=Streptomyces aureus TaxID=193461 RepID=UPI0033CACB84